MSKRISIRTTSVALEAELIDNETSNAIWESLPLEGVANTWGEEIYFSISVTMELE
ncbi:cyclophilin-like family protein, partial [Chloroflexota bacterium]